MTLTLIIGYRDRDVARLDRGLESLAAQTDTRLTVLIVDYGSSPSYSSALRTCVAGYPFASIFWVDTRGWEWNRAAALNWGAQRCPDGHIFLSDADVVYPPDFVERLYDHLSRADVVVSDCLRLPRGFDSWVTLGDPALDDKLTSVRGTGLVGCTIERYRDAGGLDEGFGYWGYEDVMFIAKMRSRGCVVNLPEDLICYHQFHEKTIYSIPYAVQFHNVTYYYRTVGTYEGSDRQTPVVRLANKSEPERPVFKFVDPDTGVLRAGVDVKVVDALNIADTTTVVGEVSKSPGTLWAFPSGSSRGTGLRQMNRILRKCGVRMDPRPGFMDDFARGLVLSVPEMFRDYYLDCRIGRKRYGVFLT